ncbi:MAG: phosphatase PAP2 family protein [Spongiibacteraceae bacterium]
MSYAPKLRRVFDIVLTHFWFKMFGTMAYTFIFFVGYVYLLKYPAIDAVTVPTIWLDRVIAFNPVALPIYLSLWFYVSIPPMLMLTPRQVVAYGVRITVLCLAAFLIFYFWPNAVPPANIDWAKYPGMAFLKGVDAAGNACPSLHVATAVFSSLWLHGRFKSLGLGVGVLWVNMLWCAAIAYSTLATKQHVAIDVIAGIALGLAVASVTRLRAHAAQIEPALPEGVRPLVADVARNIA